MHSLHSFVFNDFAVNTYLVWDQSGNCIIIDAACYADFEKRKLEAFILDNKLKPSLLVNTHGHIDHILGNRFIADRFGLELYAHADSMMFYEQAPLYGAVFGFDPGDQCKPTQFLQEGQIVLCGSMEMEVIYVPGHADGSICLYFKESSMLFSGDVLFNGSIGRSDLPTGDVNLLIKGIKEKLLPLPGETIVYPGHGDFTSIGKELNFNPYLV